jgi:hypothetical protein
MSLNSIRTWQRVLQLLHDGAKDSISSDGYSEAYLAVMDILVKLRDLTVPKSTFKKLVQQMQVCTAAHSNCCCSPAWQALGASAFAPPSLLPFGRHMVKNAAATASFSLSHSLRGNITSKVQTSCLLPGLATRIPSYVADKSWSLLHLADIEI